MPKSIIAQRKENNAVCPKCKSPDYKMSPNELIGGKPNFTCGSCGHSWQYGYTGGIYAVLAGDKIDTSNYWQEDDTADIWGYEGEHWE